MPSRKTEENQEPIENISIKLKTIRGMKPRVYVPAAWIALIILVVFLLLVLPGLRKNGTFLTVDTLPPDAEVIFDGVRLGSSGSPLFAPRGSAELVVHKFGYTDHIETVDMRGRVFASRLFPRKQQIQINLTALESYDALSQGLYEFSAWTSTGPESGRYAIPSSLTTAAREAVSGGASEIDRGVLSESALPSSLDERHLSDLFRAESIIASGGGPPSLSSLVSLAGFAAGTLSDHPGYASSIAVLIDRERLTGSGLTDLADDEATIREMALAEYENYYAQSPGIRRSTYGPYSFVTFPAQKAPAGDLEAVASGYDFRTGARPAYVSVPDFTIATREVSNSEFAAFTAEKSEWAVENRDELVLRELADETYLDDWTAAGPAPGSEDMPVTGISWFAAEAYTRWFTEKYLTDTGRTARMPDEYEWEVAARWNATVENTRDLPEMLVDADKADSGNLGILGMAGNVREWCRNPFLFNAPLFGYPDNESDIYASRTIRGGAFIDSKLAYPSAVRGGLPPEISSPVTGFRLSLD